MFDTFGTFLLLRYSESAEKENSFSYQLDQARACKQSVLPHVILHVMHVMQRHRNSSIICACAKAGETFSYPRYEANHEQKCGFMGKYNLYSRNSLGLG